MRLSKIFNLRTGLITMFSLLIVSYIILAVFYVDAINQATQPSPKSSIDVVRREKIDGYEIKVPDVVTVGEPFVYEVKGEKLIDNGADVRQQINCIVGEDGLDTVYTLGTFYSNSPKGKFEIKRSTTIAVTSRLQSSKKCVLSSIATYTFYRADNDGNESSFVVNEIATSNPFELRVVEKPATDPSAN